MEPQSQQFLSTLKHLLSILRVRENTFIILLENLKLSKQQLNQRELVEAISQDFLKEERHYAFSLKEQITKSTSSFIYGSEQQEMMIKFWGKVKKLIKVSLERIKLLSLLCLSLFKIYQEMLNLITYFIEERSDLKEIRYLENIFKKKYMYAIYGNYRFVIHTSQLISDYKGSVKFDEHKNDQLISHSKSLFRQKSKKNNKFSPNLVDNGLPPKILKSFKKQESNKRSQNSISKRMIEKDNKKLMRLTQRLQDYIYSPMDAKIDLSCIDKKRSRQNNALALYDLMFQKNIPNHKIITKFIFNSGIKVLKMKSPLKKPLAKLNLKNSTLLQRQTNKSARKLGSEKITKKRKIDEDFVDIQIRGNCFNRIKKLDSKLIKIRPKTAKNQRTDFEVKFIMENNKKRYRKLIKKSK